MTTPERDRILGLIEDLVSENRLKEAINELKRVDKLKTDAVNFGRRLQTITTKTRKGLYTLEQSEAELNKLADAIIDTIIDLALTDTIVFEEASAEPESENQHSAPRKHTDVAEVYGLFERLTDKPPLLRIALLIGMPRDMRPSNDLSYGAQQDRIIEWAEADQARLEKLGEILRGMIEKQGRT
jgi:hypothetical protein